ncbi:hypothetical protein LCGC14_0334830 [marine sediment metagenome]|uniref:Uncharacterized protein n=1 Tax=marine sediment metagenome TaxID=412755 RepID=A0A0F9TFH3_9ZZZZ
MTDDLVETRQGFYWGDVEVMRHIVNMDGSRVLFVSAPRSNLRIKISPAGLIESETNHRDLAPEGEAKTLRRWWSSIKSRQWWSSWYGGTGDKPKEVGSDYAVTGFSAVKESKDSPRHQTFEMLTDEAKAKGRWWVSWWGREYGFKLHLPWWVSGERLGTPWVDGERLGAPDVIFQTEICAAVLANSKEEARAVITDAHDDGEAGIVEWRFAEPRPVDWSPFCDRFPRADWMQWPEEERR